MDQAATSSKGDWSSHKTPSLASSFEAPSSSIQAIKASLTLSDKNRALATDESMLVSQVERTRITHKKKIVTTASRQSSEDSSKSKFERKKANKFEGSGSDSAKSKRAALINNPSGEDSSKDESRKHSSSAPSETAKSFGKHGHGHREFVTRGDVNHIKPSRDDKPMRQKGHEGAHPEFFDDNKRSAAAAHGAQSTRFSAGWSRHSKRQLDDRWKVAAWSKAGISTTVLVRDRFTKRTILFDCGGMGGVSPALMMEADLVFVSHTHADHCAGLFAHARSRFAQKSAAKYYIPEDSLEQLTQAREAFEAMDGKPLKMEFVPMRPGQIVSLGKGLNVECVPTEHRVTSMGFLIFREERRMKDEYKDLPGERKAELGKAGVQLIETVKMLELAYSGDTTAEGLDPRMFQAKLAIVECTFIDECDRHLAESTQHVLLSDLEAKIAESEPNAECQLVLMHFSARYSSSQILAAVRRASLLPKKTACALSAFQHEHMTDDDFGVSYA